MPHWVIYHPASTFTTPESKSALANDITKIYTAANLPAFYVVVTFIPVEPSSFFVGGIARPSLASTTSTAPGPESSNPFIRITIQNIARKLSSEEAKEWFLYKVDQALKGHIEEKGYDWEYSVEETDRDLWKVQGMVPPMPATEGEKLWVRENRAVPYERL